MAVPELILTGIGVPPFSVRGVIQTLTPIQQAHQIKRTVNGQARSLAIREFQKYSSVISCTDQQPPAIDGAWPGKILLVDCVKQLSFLTSEGSPSRPVIPGSLREEGLYTFYRPRLEMMVMTFTDSEDHWNATLNWSMTLEEL